MIYDLLTHIDQYEGIHRGVMQGLRFLQKTDFSALADGRYELDGDNVFANVMSYETHERNDTPESHREYIDIQYVIDGEELIAVAPLEDMTGVAEAHPERDIWLNIGPAEPLTLGRGRFIAVWPGDALAPGIAPNGVPAPARK